MNSEPTYSDPVRARVRSVLITYWLTTGALLVAVTLGFGICAGQGIILGRLGSALFGGGFFVPLAWLLFGLITRRPKVRVVPYFSGPNPDAHTFVHGSAIAVWSMELDSIAIRAGCTPLSEFGFDDEGPFSSQAWYEPIDGIRTLECLLSAHCAEGSGGQDRAELQRDLDRVLLALVGARERGLKFCLLVWVGDAVSLLEMSRRRGYVGDEWKEWK